MATSHNQHKAFILYTTIYKFSSSEMRFISRAIAWMEGKAAMGEQIHIRHNHWKYGTASSHYIEEQALALLFWTIQSVYGLCGIRVRIPEIFFLLWPDLCCDCDFMRLEFDENKWWQFVTTTFIMVPARLPEHKENNGLRQSAPLCWSWYSDSLPPLPPVSEPDRETAKFQSLNVHLNLC